MTDEHKKDLTKTLCEKLPHHLLGFVEIIVPTGHFDIWDGSMEYEPKDVLVELMGVNVDTEEISVIPLFGDVDLTDYDYRIEDFTPLLRPISSMTNAEKELYYKTLVYTSSGDPVPTPKTFDWLDEHHYDRRGLIPLGLAKNLMKEDKNPYDNAKTE